MSESGQPGLDRARRLVAQLDFPAAQQQLRELLTRSQQDSARADADEAETAVLYAGVLLQLSEPHTARTWATYAHNAMRRLHGEKDRRTLHALGVLAVTEHRTGVLDSATRHYQQLITALSDVDGPDSDRALAARADAAGVEHARGQCASARTILAEVITEHQARHGLSHPVGIRMLARLAAMWRDCGDFDRAHQILAQARASASALPPDDDTHRVLAMAARASADQSHQCGVESVRAGADGQPGVFPVLLVPSPQDLIPPSRMSASTPYVSEWPEDEILDTPPPVTMPSYLPPPAPPPPPMVFTAPRQMPVPAFRPPPPRPERPRRNALGLGMIAAGAAAAAAIALVAVALVLSGRSDDPANVAATPTASPPAAVLALPSGPVSNLRLTDQGDKLLITWVYPVGATGPIIVSAARAGEPMRALQSLPAGTESMTLPGLNPQSDYCVTVTVAYAADHLVMAPAACTNRRGGSPKA